MRHLGIEAEHQYILASKVLATITTTCKSMQPTWQEYSQHNRREQEDDLKAHDVFLSCSAAVLLIIDLNPAP